MIGATAGLSDLGAALARARSAAARVRHAGNVVRERAQPAETSPGRRSAGDSDDEIDTIEISPEGLAAARRLQASAVGGDPERDGREQLERLRRREREVRAHEAAHQAVAGQYAGKASFTYQTGPDGRRYAVSGEVPIDISPVDGDPQATIVKMQQVRRAALAPAEPSSADRQVAATAARIEARARAELQSGRSNRSDPLGLDRDPANGERPVAALPVRDDFRRSVDLYA